MRWSTVLIWRGWALLVLCAFAVLVDTYGWNPWFASIPLLAFPAAYAHVRRPNDEPPPEVSRAAQYYRLAPALFVGTLVVQWLMGRPLNPAYAMGTASLIAGLGVITSGLRLLANGE